jgi:hypothetical protein
LLKVCQFHVEASAVDDDMIASRVLRIGARWHEIGKIVASGDDRAIARADHRGTIDRIFVEPLRKQSGSSKAGTAYRSDISGVSLPRVIGMVVEQPVPTPLSNDEATSL